MALKDQTNRDLPAARAGIRQFAFLAALEATARSVLISVYPVLMYRSLGDAKTVSEAYFLIGATALSVAMLTPWIGRFVPRRFLYTGAGAVMFGAAMVGLFGGPALIPLAVGMNATALVVLTVVLSAYLMDFIERTAMGQNEAMRLLFSGLPWAVGPYLGVWLMDRNPSAPFVLSAIAVAAQMAWFWYLRLGDGKVIAKATKPPANPFAFLPRFFRQPLLVAGWTFAVMRSVGWAIFMIYLPIFAVEAGMDASIGGLSMSTANAFLFLTPLVMRLLRATNVRTMIAWGFAGAGVLYIAATLATGAPPLAVILLVIATVFLVSLDVTGGLPLLMSVKPSERTEVAAVYATFRDVSAVISPGFARLILAFGPVPAVFGACGLALIGCAALARRLHPRLGRKRAGARDDSAVEPA